MKPPKKLKKGEIAVFQMDPYYDETMIFIEKVPTAQEKYILVDKEQGLYKFNEKANVLKFRADIQTKLRSKAKPWWPYKEQLSVSINVSGPKNEILLKDLDNYLKTIFDVLKGIVYVDDHQIVDVNIHKQENPFVSGFSVTLKMETDDLLLFSREPENWDDEGRMKVSLGGIYCFDTY